MKILSYFFNKLRVSLQKDTRSDSPQEFSIEMPDLKNFLNKTYNALLTPIRRDPGFFLFCGLLLFLPELFAYALGGGSGFQALKLAVKYCVEHMGNSLAFCYAVSYLACCLLLMTKVLRIDKWFQATLLILVNLYSLSSIWLAQNFGISDLYTSLGLLFQTNGGEASEFIQTYILTWDFLKFFALCSILIAAEIFFIINVSFAAKTNRFVLRWGILVMLFLWALPMSIKNLYTAIKPQASLFSNGIMEVSRNQLCYDITTSKAAKSIDLKMDLDKMLAAPIDTCEFNSKKIVLILGESLNKSHSQLYGYYNRTMPMTESLKPAIFNDVISAANETKDVTRLLLSMALSDCKSSLNDSPLVLPIMKRAGYNVTFYSNQFIKEKTQQLFDRQGNLFFNNPKICDFSFSCRNDEKYRYDGDFVSDFLIHRHILEIDSGNNLTIIHLMGQHINAKERFPSGETFFTLNDINRPDLPDKHRQEIADYDNAVLYGDKQLYRIVNAYKDEDAIIIFLSDHGDDVNDYNIHIGRRYDYDAMPPEAFHSQFDVPFLFFATDKYKENHPEIVKQIEASLDKPYMTDALPHLLLYLAGIKTDCYIPEMNILDDNYDVHRKRIIYNTDIDYDERIRIHN